MKTVLITGAGRGLGRAIAIAYHQGGFNVIVTDSDVNLLSDIKDKEGFTCLNLDITLEKDCANCWSLISDKFTKIDMIISNAGIFDFYPVSEVGSDKLSRIFNVNVFGFANLTKFFVPLLSGVGGRIIVISSESFKVPSPFQPYAVSKQSLEAVYRAIKTELALKSIKCILIRPGAMNTRILDDTIHFRKVNTESVFNIEFDKFLETVPKYIGKIVDPQEVARLVYRVGTRKRPKHIYHINHNPLVSLLTMLPPRIQNWIIFKSLK